MSSSQRSKGRPPRLADGTPVVRSEHFAEQCEGVVSKALYDDGWLYRIEVTDGDRLDAHRTEDGELWIWPVRRAGRDAL
jgi:hypothetical protein